MDAVLEFINQVPVQKAIWAIVLFVVCMIAIKVILSVFDKCIKNAKIDTLVRKVLRISIKALLLFITVITVLSSLGVSVSSLIAALSVVGVAFSMAIQDFLSNVFGGLQIISNHPFKIGDYVEAGGEAGTVREVGLFYTKLDTPDKKLIQIPNSKIANDSIVNYSNAANRRLEFLVSLSYDNEVERVQEVMLKLLNDHPMIFKEEGMMPAVHVKEFRDNDVCYTARAWCENANYWTVYFDVMDALKPTLEKNGIHFSYPHVNVHMVSKD